ncbi:MAG TPA: hypothetical protein VIV60_29170, partial [Polyangiaceae bacterium]
MLARLDSSRVQKSGGALRPSNTRDSKALIATLAASVFVTLFPSESHAQTEPAAAVPIAPTPAQPPTQTPLAPTTPNPTVPSGVGGTNDSPLVQPPAAASPDGAVAAPVPPDAASATPTPAADAAPPKELPTSTDEETYKHINMGIWLRIAGVAQNPQRQNRIDRLSSNAEVEVHFSNRMRKWIQWTANFVGTYGYGSIDGAGQFALLDLIAQLEPHDAFNLWVGRMLVPSDRANFAGPYFMAPWNYPGAFGAGPKEGPFGRNDGATIWGQFGGGTFKYYAGAYNLYGDRRTDGQYTAPLFSGRLNLSLLNPEPGYYHSATYYGKDILALAVGGQYQKNGTPGATVVVGGVDVAGPAADYGLFNADLLFEKQLGGAGVIDVEGALYKYVGDNETRNLSYFALASYLTPALGGAGRLQPLVRLQQTTYKSVAGQTPDAATAFDGQVGYVIDSYATRLALGFQHSKDSAGNI